MNNLRCEVCGAAIAEDQRYCVECGNHRIGIRDPAASFMNRANARPAPPAGRAVIVSSRRSRQLTALAFILVPVALAVGVLVGRGSNNQDRKLLRALGQERNRVVTVPGRTQVVTVGGGAGAVISTKGSSKRHATPSHTTSAATHKVSGSVGSSSNTAQKQQSAKIVKKLQSTNGLSYLNPLPSQVGG